MSPNEAIEHLESMQAQIIHGKPTFKEIADLIKEARYLIANTEWYHCNNASMIVRAEKWITEK